MKTLILCLTLGALTFSARADVPAVRREVARIESALPSLAKSTHQRFDLSAEGAGIAVYGARKSPRKIKAEIFGEGGRKTDTIYLQEGAPLFRFEIEERYEHPVGPQANTKIISRSETRFYFQNGRLFQMRSGTKKLPLSAATKRRIERETRENVRLYLEREDGRAKAAR